jgi:hypothetical protein
MKQIILRYPAESKNVKGEWRSSSGNGQSWITEQENVRSFDPLTRVPVSKCFEMIGINAQKRQREIISVHPHTFAIRRPVENTPVCQSSGGARKCQPQQSLFGVFQFTGAAIPTRRTGQSSRL